MNFCQKTIKIAQRLFGTEEYKEILWSCARQSSTLVALSLTTYNFFTKHVAFFGKPFTL